MTLIVENGCYQLFYVPEKINQYVVYKTVECSPPSDLKLKTAVCQAAIFTKKLKSFFTPAQLNAAAAKTQYIKCFN